MQLLLAVALWHLVWRKMPLLSLIKLHLCFAWPAAEKRNLLSSLASIFPKNSSSARERIKRQASTPVFAGNPRSRCSTWKSSMETEVGSATQLQGLCCLHPNTQRQQKHSQKYGKTEEKAALIFLHSAEHRQDPTCNLYSPIHHWDNRISSYH